MRDRQPLIERISRDLSTVEWLEPAEIRARARRRTARTATVVCAAFLVLVASVSALAVHRPQPAVTGHPATPAPPVLLAIPPEALLQADDVGGKADTSEMFRDDETVLLSDPSLDSCMSARRLVLPKTAGFLRAQSLLRPPEPAADRKTDSILDEYVGRFAAGDAGRFIDEVRRVADICGEFRTGGPVERDGRTVQVDVWHRWTLLEAATGDQALVLRYEGRAYDRATGDELDGPVSRILGVVRVGDLVAVVQPWDTDFARLRVLLKRAAARLCVAANPRC